jgi:hypothetical protein
LKLSGQFEQFEKKKKQNKRHIPERRSKPISGAQNVHILEAESRAIHVIACAKHTDKFM